MALISALPGDIPKAFSPNKIWIIVTDTKSKNALSSSVKSLNAWIIFEIACAGEIPFSGSAACYTLPFSFIDNPIEAAQNISLFIIIVWKGNPGKLCNANT